MADKPKDINKAVQDGENVPKIIEEAQPMGTYLLERKKELKALIARSEHELSMIDQAGLVDPVALLNQEAPVLGTILQDAVKQIERRKSGHEVPMPLPWKPLADAMGSGLWPGLHVLVGGTGTGKTQMALQVALHAAQDEKHPTPVLYIGLEMNRVQLVARLLGIESGEYWSKIYRGEVYPQDLEHAISTLEALPIHLENAPPYGWDYSTLYERAKAFKEKYRGLVEYKAPTGPSAGERVNIARPFLIVLDFLQLVASTERTDLRQTIQQAAYAARAVARDLGAAVILISSTAREHYSKMITQKKGTGTIERKEDRGNGFITAYEEDYLGTGKESGEVEYSADSVLVLTRGPYEEGTPRKINLCLAKNREGKTAWVELTFNGNLFLEPAEPKRTSI